MRTVRYAAFLLGCMGCNAPHGDAKGEPSPATSMASSAASSTLSSTPVAPIAPSPVSAAPVDAIIAQHVLVTYRGARRAPKSIVRTKADAKARALEALGKARGGEPFEDVVKSYSDDAATVDRMGSLGKFRRDSMDPAFANAAFALAVGAVSDVVETPFGFHVIKRTQ